METAQNGKGDSPRNCFSRVYQMNYDEAFPGKRKYSLRDAAIELGIGYSTLRQKIRHGEISVESQGRNTNFIYRAELEAYKRRKQQRKIAI